MTPLSRAEIARRYRERHPERAKETQRRYKKKNKDKLYRSYRAWRYGLSADELKALEAVTNCELCDVELTTGRGAVGRCIDHDHETDKVRGVLCNLCNKMLGSAKDNPETLFRAAQYLNHHQETK